MKLNKCLSLFMAVIASGFVSLAVPSEALADYCCRAKCAFGSCVHCGSTASCGCTLGVPWCHNIVAPPEESLTADTQDATAYWIDDGQLSALEDYIRLTYDLGLHDVS